MNRDDIFRMAREADLYEGSDDQVIRFAFLVAAAEREACAKVVEQAGMEGYGTLAAALLVRERGAP